METEGRIGDDVGNLDTACLQALIRVIQRRVAVDELPAPRVAGDDNPA